MKRKALAFFACLGIILTAFTSCHSETSTTKEQIEFADGSVMIAQNGPKYYHRLFDDYVLNSGYGYFEQVIEKLDLGYPFKYTQLSVKQGYYVKYAFDPSGYIAYYRIVKAKNEQTSHAYRKNIGGKSRSIVSEDIVLYNCKEDRETFFESFADLYSYCDENAINLGEMYYAKGYGSLPEEPVVNVNRWTIAMTPWDYCVVKNDRVDIFMGDVDEYSIINDHLVFHLELLDDFDCLKDMDLSIEYSEETVIGYKRRGLFQKNGVYSDNYIVVNTKTNECKVFDTKEEAVEYLSVPKKSISWSKL